MKKNIHINPLMVLGFCLSLISLSLLAEDQHAGLEEEDFQFVHHLDEYGQGKVYTYDQTKPEYRGAQKAKDLPFEKEEIERLGKKNGKYLWYRSAVSVPMNDENGKGLLATAEYLLYLGPKTNVLILPNGNRVWGRVASAMQMNYLPGMMKFPIFGIPGQYLHRIPAEGMKVCSWNFSYFSFL